MAASLSSGGLALLIERMVSPWVEPTTTRKRGSFWNCAIVSAAGKFGKQPQYGKAMKGYIGLQEHGGRAEFRNIKIRELK